MVPHGLAFSAISLTGCEQFRPSNLNNMSFSRIFLPLALETRVDWEDWGVVVGALSLQNDFSKFASFLCPLSLLQR